MEVHQRPKDNVSPLLIHPRHLGRVCWVPGMWPPYNRVPNGHRKASGSVGNMARTAI